MTQSPTSPHTFHDYAHGKAVRERLSLSVLARILALPSYHLVLVACGFMVIAHAVYAPIWLSVVAILTIIFQLPSIKRKLGKNLVKNYQRVQLAIFIFGVIGLFVSFAQPFSTDMSVSFLLLCLFCKLWELKDKRDAYIVLNLCLFVLASAFLWSQGLGLSILAFFGLGATLLGFIALSDDTNATGAGRLRSLAFLLLPSLPLLIVLFLFFPRLPPLWSLSMSGKQATTGVSDSMSPGDFVNLSKSAELAFRVEFEGKVPNRSELYFRGLVFTDYDGITWTPSKARGRFSRSMDSVPDWAKLSGKSLGYKVILEPTYQHWLYALEYSRPLPQRGVAISDKFTLGSYEPVGTQFRYQASYYPTAKVGMELSQAEEQEALSLPKGNPKTHALAERLKSQANGDTLKMVALFRQFVLDNEFSYTLSPPALEGDRADAFLFGTRAGFCEHYASSFATLMRAAGVPTRVVAGYQGGQLGRDGASWEVRQMDAHAWTEVWVMGQGWVRVDPTGFVSPDRVFDGMSAVTENAGAAMFGDGVAAQIGYQQFRLLQSIYRLSDQAGYYWQTQVVGFDQETQKNSLLQWFNIKNLTEQVLMLATSFGVGLGLIVLMLWYKRRVVYDAVDLPIVRLSNQLGKKDMMLAKQPSESYLGYLKRLSELAGADESLAAEYRCYRFGKEKVNTKDFEKKIRDFSKKLKKVLAI